MPYFATPMVVWNYDGYIDYIDKLYIVQLMSFYHDNDVEF